MAGPQIGTISIGVTADTSQARREINSFQNQVQKNTFAITGSLTRAGTQLTVGLTLPIALATKSFIQAAAAVEQLSQEAAAIGQLTLDNFSFDRLTESAKALSEQAIDIARENKFTTQEVATAQVTLAKAGFETNTILAEQGKLVQQVSAFAVAANLDIAKAADIAAQSLGALGFTTQDERLAQLGRVTDVLNVSASLASTGVQDLGQALIDAGPIATELGVQVEELGAAMAVLSNAGFEGTRAGTGLRAIFNGLVAPAKKDEKILKDLGIVTSDAAGNFIGFTNVLQQFQRALADVGQEQRTATAFELFGQRGGPAFLNLMNEASGQMVTFAEMTGNAAGSTRKLEQAMLDTASGQFALLSSSFESFSLTVVNSGLLDFTRALANSLEDITDKFGAFAAIDANKPIVNTTLALIGMAAAFGPLIRIIGFFSDNFQPLTRLFTVAAPSATLLWGPIVALAGGFAIAAQESVALQEALKRLGMGFVNFVTGIGGGGDSFETIGNSISAFIDKLREPLKEVGDQLANFINSTLDSQSIGNSIFETIDTALINLGNAAPKIIEVTSKAIAGIVEFIRVVGDDALKTAGLIFISIGEGMGAVAVAISTAAPVIAPFLETILRVVNVFIEATDTVPLLGLALDLVFVRMAASYIPIVNKFTRSLGILGVSLKGYNKTAQSFVNKDTRIVSNFEGAPKLINQYRKDSVSAFKDVRTEALLHSQALQRLRIDQKNLLDMKISTGGPSFLGIDQFKKGTAEYKKELKSFNADIAQSVKLGNRIDFANSFTGRGLTQFKAGLAGLSASFKTFFGSFRNLKDTFLVTPQNQQQFINAFKLRNAAAEELKSKISLLGAVYANTDATIIEKATKGTQAIRGLGIAFQSAKFAAMALGATIASIALPIALFAALDFVIKKLGEAKQRQKELQQIENTLLDAGINFADPEFKFDSKKVFTAEDFVVIPDNLFDEEAKGVLNQWIGQDWELKLPKMVVGKDFEDIAGVLSESALRSVEDARMDLPVIFEDYGLEFKKNVADILNIDINQADLGGISGSHMLAEAIEKQFDPSVTENRMKILAATEQAALASGIDPAEYSAAILSGRIKGLEDAEDKLKNAISQFQDVQKTQFISLATRTGIEGRVIRNALRDYFQVDDLDKVDLSTINEQVLADISNLTSGALALLDADIRETTFYKGIAALPSLLDDGAVSVGKFKEAIGTGFDPVNAGIDYLVQQEENKRNLEESVKAAIDKTGKLTIPGEQIQAVLTGDVLDLKISPQNLTAIQSFVNYTETTLTDGLGMINQKVVDGIIDSSDAKIETDKLVENTLAGIKPWLDALPAETRALVEESIRGQAAGFSGLWAGLAQNMRIGMQDAELQPILEQLVASDFSPATIMKLIEDGVIGALDQVDADRLNAIIQQTLGITEAEFKLLITPKVEFAPLPAEILNDQTGWMAADFGSIFANNMDAGVSSFVDTTGVFKSELSAIDQIMAVINEQTQMDPLTIPTSATQRNLNLISQTLGVIDAQLYGFRQGLPSGFGEPGYNSGTGNANGGIHGFSNGGLAGFAAGGLSNFQTIRVGETGPEMILPSPITKPVQFAKTMMEGFKAGFFGKGTIPTGTTTAGKSVNFADNKVVNIYGVDPNQVIARMRAEEESTFARIGGVLD